MQRKLLAGAREQVGTLLGEARACRAFDPEIEESLPLPIE